MSFSPVFDKEMDKIQSILASSYSTFDSTTLLLALATMAVITRFVAKSFTKARFSFDDYWISFSLIVFGTYAGVQYWVIFNRGGGLDLRKMREMNLVELLLIYEVRETPGLALKSVYVDKA